MKTDDLIQKLSLDLKPVKSMPSPFRMTGLFAAMGLVLIGLSFLIMSSRADLKDHLSNPEFLFDIGLSFLSSLSALSLSAVFSRPGRQSDTSKLEKMTLGFLALILIYDGYRVAQLSQSQIQVGLSRSGAECFIAVFGFSIVLGAALIFWLRRGASVNPQLSGLVVATACVTLGNVSIAFFCGIDNGMHILVWHFGLPMIAALVIGVIAGRFMLKW